MSGPILALSVLRSAALLLSCPAPIRLVHCVRSFGILVEARLGSLGDLCRSETMIQSTSPIASTSIMTLRNNKAPFPAIKLTTWCELDFYFTLKVESCWRPYHYIQRLPEIGHGQGTCRYHARTSSLPSIWFAQCQVRAPEHSSRAR